MDSNNVGNYDKIIKEYSDNNENNNDRIKTNENNSEDNQNELNLTPGKESNKRKKIKWSDKHVDILVDWADKAMCYRWLHSRNTDRYKSLNTWFTIPVIIMSTLTGTANFAQEQVPIELRSYYSMIVGSVNILAGIITTIQNFLKISQLNEAHRVAAIAWDKFYRKIKLELAKSPDERINVEIFLKNSSEEFDRLVETSPDIDSSILKKFKTTFEGKKNFSQKIKEFINHKLLIDEHGELVAVTEKQKAFKQISKPVVYDYLEPVRNTVYQPPKEEINPSIHVITPIKEKIISETTKNSITEIIKQIQNLEYKENKLIKFCNEFEEKYSREPTEDEIIENLENEEEGLTKVVINNFISKFKENKQQNNCNTENNESQTNTNKDSVIIDINT